VYLRAGLDDLEKTKFLTLPGLCSFVLAAYVRVDLRIFMGHFHTFFAYSVSFEHSDNLVSSFLSCFTFGCWVYIFVIRVIQFQVL
jgi:hypothetical protein